MKYLFLIATTLLMGPFAQASEATSQYFVCKTKTVSNRSYTPLIKATSKDNALLLYAATYLAINDDGALIFKDTHPNNNIERHEDVLMREYRTKDPDRVVSSVVCESAQ